MIYFAVISLCKCFMVSINSEQCFKFPPTTPLASCDGYDYVVKVEHGKHISPLKSIPGSSFFSNTIFPGKNTGCTFIIVSDSLSQILQNTFFTFSKLKTEWELGKLRSLQHPFRRSVSAFMLCTVRQQLLISLPHKLPEKLLVDWTPH